MIRYVIITAVIVTTTIAAANMLIAAEAKTDFAPADSTPKPVEPVMANDPLRQSVWDEMLDAGTNTRYWSALAEQASTKESYCKLISIVLGLLAVTMPMLFHDVKHKWVVRCFHLCNVIALGVSLVFLMNTSADAHQLSFIQKQWSSLETQWKSLRQQRDSMRRDILQGRVDSLIAQRESIEASEPAETNHPELHKAWAAEMKSRGFDDFVAQREKALSAKQN